MSITISKRPSLGGGVIFTSKTATTIKDAIEMRPALKSGNQLDLQGANLQDANLLCANLHDANLLCADLCGANLQDANLQDANLQDANLCGADLRGANLRDANLRGASFGGGEAGRGITPESLGLPNADPLFALSVIEAASAPNALQMDSWHTCETTHCLAGWAVHLAGAAGKALESVTSPSVAGAILAPSLAHLFYADNEEALEALPVIKAELLEQCGEVVAEDTEAIERAV